MTKLKLKTYLPLFNGFYNTIWDNTDRLEDLFYSEIEDTKLAKKCLDNYIESDDYQIDYKNYEIEVVKEACNVIEKELVKLGVIEALKYEALIQPKYYNYSNDSVNIEIIINKNNIEAIKNILNNNKDFFIKEVKDNFTSYDGFTSYYSNNFESQAWSLLNIINDDTQLGFILEAILKLNKYNEYSLYEDTIYNIDYDYANSYKYMDIKN